MRKIFTILGKTCVGKDSLSKLVSKETGYPIALSFTTRPKRVGETEGVEYNFINKEHFLDLVTNDLLAECTSYDVTGGEVWYYGLTKEELEKDEYVLAIVNPDGYNQIKKIYGDKVCSILIDADVKTRIERYLNRDEVDNIKALECCRRVLFDEKDFKDLATDYKVINHNMEEAYSDLLNIIKNVVAKDIMDATEESFKNDPKGFLGR